MIVNQKNYFEDVDVGYSYESPSITVSEAHVLGFAGLTGDFTQVHVDEAFAREMGFRGRLAHGILGLGLIDALKNRCLVDYHVVAALGWEWRFAGALYVGDQLKARLRVADKRPTSNGGRGIITIDIQGINGSGEVVQEGSTKIMVLCRPAA